MKLTLPTWKKSIGMGASGYTFFKYLFNLYFNNWINVSVFNKSSVNKNTIWMICILAFFSIQSFLLCLLLNIHWYHLLFYGKIVCIHLSIHQLRVACFDLLLKFLLNFVKSVKFLQNLFMGRSNTFGNSTWKTIWRCVSIFILKIII